MPKDKNVTAFNIEQYIEEEYGIENEYYEDEIEDEEEEDYDTYTEIEEDDEKYESASKTFAKTRPDRFIRIFNVIFIILIILIMGIGIDVICVAKYNKGPFFAIKTKTYKDGGTREYLGLGYKVIKYSEVLGRKDTQLGFWNLKYNTTPIEVEDIDLAIEFQNKPNETANKFYKQYVKISSTLKIIDKSYKKLAVEYTDPDGKYTLKIVCDGDFDKNLLSQYKVDEPITIKGTIYEFRIKEGQEPNRAYIKHCIPSKETH